MGSKDALWPAVEVGYEEEFGPINPGVDRIARDLWPGARNLARDLLHDSDAGYRLLKRAVAAVSRITAQRPDTIRHPAAYLFQTYRRLVLAELQAAHVHRSRAHENASAHAPVSDEVARIERQILVTELIGRMDPWTREVFEALVLGYSFDEIGHALGANPHVVRNRFRLRVRSLKGTLEGSGLGAGHQRPAANARTARNRRDDS